MHLRPSCDRIPLVKFQVDIEMLKRVIADVFANVAQVLEFWEPIPCRRSLRNEPTRQTGKGALQLFVTERYFGVRFEGCGCRVHYGVSF